MREKDKRDRINRLDLSCGEATQESSIPETAREGEAERQTDRKRE